MNVNIQGLPLIGSLIPEDALKESSENGLNAMLLIYIRTIEAFEAFKARQLQKFDALVGDQACQIRALKVVLLSSGDLAVPIAETAQKLGDLIKVKRALEGMKEEKERDQMKELKDSLEVSSCLAAEKKAAIEKEPARKRAIIASFADRFAAENEKQKTIKARIENEFTERRCKLLTLGDFDMQVDEEALFLIQAYLLTVGKNTVRVSEQNGMLLKAKDDLAVKNLDQEIQIEGEKVKLAFPSVIMEKVLIAAKRSLSQLSVAFVQQQALFLGSSCQHLQAKICKVKAGIEELPFFYMTHIVFQKALESQIPILLKIRNQSEDPLRLSSFAFRKYFPGDGRSIGIVIEAYSFKTRSELKSLQFNEMQTGILEIIDFNTAQHHQYTDETGFEAIPGMEEAERIKMEQMKIAAEKKGFSEKNPSLCCIEHVFCDEIQNQLKET